jgi:hypothetical protein
MDPSACTESLYRPMPSAHAQPVIMTARACRPATNCRAVGEQCGANTNQLSDLWGLGGVKGGGEGVKPPKRMGPFVVVCWAVGRVIEVWLRGACGRPHSLSADGIATHREASSKEHTTA